MCRRPHQAGPSGEAVADGVGARRCAELRGGTGLGVALQGSLSEGKRTGVHVLRRRRRRDLEDKHGQIARLRWS